MSGSKRNGTPAATKAEPVATMNGVPITDPEVMREAQRELASGRLLWAPLPVLQPVAQFIRSTCGKCFHYVPFNNRATGVCNRFPPSATAGDGNLVKVGQPQVGFTTKSCGEFHAAQTGEPVK